jgi:dTDP-4-dehydrorhamnose 3,5-epimerase
MRTRSTPIEGLLVIEPDVYADDRGYFYESFSQKRYREIIAAHNFVQDNISRSQKGTIRGLHYQIGEFAQGKLCQVLAGKVLDIAVDIRFGSPTFGKVFATELSDENHHQFWMPPGFAHGFSVLSETATFHYKCTALYSKVHERAVRYNDPALGIDWKVKDPLVSAKDELAPLLGDIDQDFTYDK